MTQSLSLPATDRWVRILTDEEREAAAEDDPVRKFLLRGPPETAKCKHGRLWSFRWSWRRGEPVAHGEPGWFKVSCRLCLAEMGV